jgi:hypothetical protein
MKRIFSALVLLVVSLGLNEAWAQGDAAAIVDKGIAALGGKDKLSQAKVLTWKAKGTLTFGENTSEFTSQTTAQGLDRSRGEFEGDFGGNKFKGITVIAADKGWRKFGDMGMEMDADALANEKRNLYLQLIPITLLPLKEKDFKVEAAGEEKVGDAAALVIKVTAPDGKDFQISFDKESGLPLKTVAKVRGFMGEEFTQETTLSGYKDFGGIKKATKIENKRDGQSFIKIELTEFKVLDKVDDKTFTQPE